MMPVPKTLMLATAASLIAFAPITGALAQPAGMTFFVTSAGPGDGAKLGGLEGADAHCHTLAEAAGVMERPGARTSAPAATER
jgi:hypothetical protein